MGLFTRRRPVRMQSIVAAATVIESAAGKDSAKRRRSEDWQRRAWEFYDLVGEARQAARSVGDVFARVPWYVGVRVDPTAPPVPLADPNDPAFDEIVRALPEAFWYTAEEALTATELLAELASPLGGQSEIRRQIGVSLFVPGECYLVGEENTDGDREWRIRSTEEIEFDWSSKQKTKGGKERPTPWLRDPSGKRTGELDPDSPIIRIWRPHPRAQDIADSPMRASLEILEELVILTRAIKGSAISRIANAGIMFLPNAMRRLNSPQQADGQASRGDPVVADILEATQLAISDPASAAAQIPLMLWVDDNVYEKVAGTNPLLQWGHDIDEVAAAQRGELLARFANSIDWPAELLTGKAGLNHWTAWLLRDEAFQSNVEPLEVLACDAVTNAYLRPALEAEGISLPERFAVWYQPVGVVSDPDQGAKALQASEQLLISWERTRRDLGYSEDDAPSEEEMRQRIAISAFIRNPALGQVPTLNSGEGPPPAVEPTAVITDRNVAPRAVFALTSGMEDIPDRLADLDVALFVDVHEQADAAMRRALERANAQLRTLAAKDARTKSLIAGISPASLLIAPTLGPGLVGQLTGATDDAPGEDLFAGALAAFLAWYDERLTRADVEILAILGEHGFPDEQRPQAEIALADARARSGTVIAAGLTALAPALLLRPRPLEPPGEVSGHLVPAGTVRAGLLTAGGGGTGAAALTTGDLVSALFRQAGIGFAGYVWRYGDPSRRLHSFDPHRRLNGLRFANENDDRLGNPGGFPGVSHFWPGDHKGCACLVVLAGPAPLPESGLPSAR